MKKPHEIKLVIQRFSFVIVTHAPWLVLTIIIQQGIERMLLQNFYEYGDRVNIFSFFIVVAIVAFLYKLNLRRKRFETIFLIANAVDRELLNKLRVANPDNILLSRDVALSLILERSGDLDGFTGYRAARSMEELVVEPYSYGVAAGRSYWIAKEYYHRELRFSHYVS